MHKLVTFLFFVFNAVVLSWCAPRYWHSVRSDSGDIHTLMQRIDNYIDPLIAAKDTIGTLYYWGETMLMLASFIMGLLTPLLLFYYSSAMADTWSGAKSFARKYISILIMHALMHAVLINAIWVIYSWKLDTLL